LPRTASLPRRGSRALRPSLRCVRPGTGEDRGPVRQGHPGEVQRVGRRELPDPGDFIKEERADLVKHHSGCCGPTTSSPSTWRSTRSSTSRSGRPLRRRRGQEDQRRGGRPAPARRDRRDRRDLLGDQEVGDHTAGTARRGAPAPFFASAPRWLARHDPSIHPTRAGRSAAGGAQQVRAVGRAASRSSVMVAPQASQVAYVPASSRARPGPRRRGCARRWPAARHSCRPSAKGTARRQLAGPMRPGAPFPLPRLARCRRASSTTKPWPTS